MICLSKLTYSSLLCTERLTLSGCARWELKALIQGVKYSQLEALIWRDPPKCGVNLLFSIRNFYSRGSTQMGCQLIIPNQKLLFKKINRNKVSTYYSRSEALIRGDPSKQGVDLLFPIGRFYLRRSTQMGCQFIILDWKLLFEAISPNRVSTTYSQFKAPIQEDPPTNRVSVYYSCLK